MNQLPRLSFEIDHDADPVDADRELARFLLRYVRRNANSSDGETATPSREKDIEIWSAK